MKKMRVFKGKIKSICNVAAYALFGKMTLRYKDAKKATQKVEVTTKKYPKQGITLQQQ